MKNLLLSLFVVSSLSIGMNTATAAALKIGVVSVERILSEAPQVDAVNTKMLEQFGPKRDELKTMESDIKSLQENYKRNELVMTEDKLNKLKKEIITKIQTLKQKEAVLTQDVAKVRNKELAKLQESVRGIIDDIAKSGKYSLILSEGVAFADDSLNITDQVLKKMKAKFKK